MLYTDIFLNVIFVIDTLPVTEVSNLKSSIVFGLPKYIILLEPLTFAICVFAESNLLSLNTLEIVGLFDNIENILEKIKIL